MSNPAFNENQKTNINNMKKNLTLDLNQPKMSMSSMGLSVLSSPEINSVLKVDTPDLLLKVDTPTIENIILANGIPNTPSPSLIFPRDVTVEQEKFAGGFMEALNYLHNGNSQQGSDSNTSTVFNDQSNFMPVVKEEPQTVPNVSNTPPMSPVDMEYQERMKLERKRQRNRLAASKCRSRKLERISKLEDKVKLLKNENADLASVVNQLKEHVGLLKLEVMQHVNAGCPIITQY
ncbi:bZIP 1 and/or Jun domain containing protein [Asbolus verrucosus]|uniref:BZIP 1 and/or Jun domain containing protein n=1 Tax=Asbolus verrucosus TaxID=1661398 RepID=A0A482W9N7_ASBVE|nr:bZIP 1 and/or Jun domain containing protein [Asbolus verrucosus]